MALSLNWAFGFNKDIVGGVHNLSDESRSAIFYVAAHTGVIYDYATREQRLLQGHCNPITACCVSEDKRWIATADSGPDSVIVIWDSLSATPVKTIFNPHPHGVCAMDLSPDAMFLVSLSAVPAAPDAAASAANAANATNEEGGGAEGEAEAVPQRIALWEWTNEREGALYEADVRTADTQHCVHFNTGDIREIVTNGKERVIFWSWEKRRFDFYSPPLSQRDFKQVVGAFTRTVFIPDSAQAITATVDGDLILWGRSLGSGGGGGGNGGGEAEKTAIKIIRVSGNDVEGSAIWFLAPAEGYLVLGSDDGAVRFFDYQFRLVAWFEDLEAGAVTSVSFANTRPPPVADGLSETPFTVPDFVVGTKRAFVVGAEAAMFEEVRPDARRGTLLVQGLDDEVHGLDAHPFLPQLAVACYSGSVQLWDYAERRLLMVRPFDPRKLRPQTLGFDANGRFLAVGYTSGVLKVLDAASLDDVATFRCHLSHGGPGGPASVVEVAFSSDAQYLAVATSDHHVAIWQFGVDGDKVLPEEEEPVEEWVYLGRSRSHTAPITGLSFALSVDQLPLLVSVGEDCRLVEYHLQKSTVAAGVHLRAPPTVIDGGAEAGVPTACVWHPAGGAGGPPGSMAMAEGEQVLVANSAYKLKAWHCAPGADKRCTRTVLGQTFGGPLNRLVPIPGAGGAETGGGAGGAGGYVAYSTANKVIGVMQLPLDGNPNKMMGLVAHPGEISGLAVSFDGRYVMTAGGKDVTVNLWATDVGAVGAAVEEGGGGAGGAEPFLRLLEGGEGGEAHSELVDYFYYAQVRVAAAAAAAAAA